MRQVSRRINRQLQYVGMGLHFSDKLRIFIFELLRLGPRLSGLQSIVNREFLKRSRWLLNGVTVVVEESRFHILDLDCLGVLSKESETFMSCWFIPKPSDVVVDIGAHVGKYAVYSAKAVGERGRVVAFEPDETNYEALLRNLLLNNVQNVTPLRIAAWDDEEDLKLYHNDMSGRHSVKSDWKGGYELVEARPVGTVLKELGIGRVDWVKVDVEGAECEALQGLKEILPSNPKMVVEVSSNNVQKIKDFAHDTDYHMIAISPRIGDKIYVQLTRY
jgi:FkbM family methyltransferase